MIHSTVVTAPLGHGTVENLREHASAGPGGLLHIELARTDFHLPEQVIVGQQLNALRQSFPEQLTVLIEGATAATPAVLGRAVHWVSQITAAISTANIDFVWVLHTTPSNSAAYHQSYLQIAPLVHV